MSGTAIRSKAFVVVRGRWNVLPMLPTVFVEILNLPEQFPVRILQGKYLFLLLLLELWYRTVVLQDTAAG